MRCFLLVSVALACAPALSLAPSAASAQTAANLVPLRPPPDPYGGDEPPPSDPEALALWEGFYRESGFLPRRDNQVPRDAYFAVLARWAEEPGPTAVELLAEFESRLRDYDHCYFPEEEDLVKRFADTAPGSVLSIALLHADVWDHNLEHGRYGNLFGDAVWIEELAQRHVKSLDGSDEARQEAADLLTYFAERLWEHGYVDLLEAAKSVLSRALDLKPDHVAARYLRAMMNEKEGFYRRALRDFEDLSRRRPTQGDVTLRVAVQLERRGKEKRAASLLDGLIERRTQTPDWVHVVAYQERIRSALEHESLERARELVADARLAHPKNTRFALMEIELDRRSTNKPSPRSQVLLDGWREDSGVTPRLRYLQGPVPELDAVRRRLEPALERRRVDLLEGSRRLRAQTVGMSGWSLRCAGTWKALAWQPEEKTPADEEPGADAELAEKGSLGKAPAEDPAEPGPTISPATLSGVSLPTIDESRKAAPMTAGDAYVDPTTGQLIRVDEVMDLELQQLYVTPIRLGRRGIALDASKLTVVDDGKRQEIVTFEQGNIPFTATLLIDASGSMRGPRMARALHGARAFLGGMAPLDRARLVIAADRLRGVSPFVADDDAAVAELVRRLDQTPAVGGTALFDHLFLTLDALETAQGRKVVIVLSDGFDLMSVVPMDSVREAVRRGQTQVYWVRLREGAADFTPPTGWRGVGDTREEIWTLERTVRESGGEVVEITDPEDVPYAFAQILEDLRNQIALGYYADPAHGDGRWRDVEVKAQGLGIRLRHVAGYFDE